MASRMVVSPSKDTLFLRGFSSKVLVDEISRDNYFIPVSFNKLPILKNYFSKEGYKSSVEFSKETDNQDKQFLALRFESRDRASEVKNRFDNKDILGDRIRFSWFVDHRRARARVEADRRRRRSSRGDDYYDRGGYAPRYTKSPANTRGRNKDYESSSPSVSRSRSRSHSNSRSRSRDRSRSAEKNYHKRSRSASQNHDPVGKDRSPHLDSSPEPIKEVKIRKKEKASSKGSDDDKDKRQRYSQSHERSVSRDRYPDNRNNKGHADPGRQVRDSPSPVRTKRVSMGKMEMLEPDASASDEEPDERFKEVQRRNWKVERDFRYPDHHFEGGRFHKNRDFSPERSRRTKYEYYNRLYSPEARVGDRPRNQGNEALVEHVDQYYPDQDADYVFHDRRTGSRAEQRVDDVSINLPEERPKRPSKEGREPRVIPDMTSSESYRAPAVRRKQSFEEEPNYERRADFEYTDVPETRRDYDDGFSKKKRRFTEEPSPVVREGKRESYDDTERFPERQRPAASRPREERAKTPPAVEDPPRNYEEFGDGVSKEVEKGALGLPQDKMVLVREKKEEIEKAYRQDCETFAAVAKMLISKDTDLETKLQRSLQENLKEIGQRCLQELKDFMDRLQSEHDIHR